MHIWPNYSRHGSNKKYKTYKIHLKHTEFFKIIIIGGKNWQYFAIYRLASSTTKYVVTRVTLFVILPK